MAMEETMSIYRQLDSVVEETGTSQLLWEWVRQKWNHNYIRYGAASRPMDQQLHRINLVPLLGWHL